LRGNIRAGGAEEAVSIHASATLLYTYMKNHIDLLTALINLSAAVLMANQAMLQKAASVCS